MDEKVLIEAANGARGAAYCPYSGISVGAALLTEDGKIYTGANIENAAFSPSVCAERVALFSAVHDGARAFSAIAVCGGKRGKAPTDFFPPCGVCRQALSEFCPPDLKVYMAIDTERYVVRTLSELLPEAFGAERL